MSIISGFGGSAPFQSKPQPSSQTEAPPAEKQTSPSSAGAEPPQQSNTRNNTQTSTPPVEAAKGANESTGTKTAPGAAAVQLSAAPSSDAPPVSVFAGPAVPLPIEEYLPDRTPSPETLEAAARAQAEAANNDRRTEQLLDRLAASATPPAKGEALNLLVPMPDGVEPRAEPESADS